MKRNMSTLDRILRLVLVVLIAIMYFTDAITGTWALILLVISGILLITSLLGVCPLYVPFGISTRKKS